MRMNDNAMMESFFKSFKSDAYYGKHFTDENALSRRLRSYFPQPPTYPLQLRLSFARAVRGHLVLKIHRQQKSDELPPASRVGLIQTLGAMTHIIDLSGTYESLFQLRHLVTGSREYCRREMLHFGDDDYTPEEWEMLRGQLHFLVSKSLITCAINFRVLQDTLRGQASAADLKEAEDDLALDQHDKLGDVLQGNVTLNLRESANKIIHATSFDLEFQEARTGKPAKKYSYWNGFVLSAGSQGQKKWRIRLDIFSWCIAIDTYIQCLSGDVKWR